MNRFTRSSNLSAPADEVWAYVTRMPSINREMGPYLRMTYPPEAASLSLDAAAVEPGVPLFDSWVLVAGIVPVERLSVTLVELGPGRRFVEQSKTLVMKSWRHERTVEQDGAGCTVTDRLALEAPIERLGRPIARVLGLFFDHRHRRLRAQFGGRENLAAREGP